VQTSDVTEVEDAEEESTSQKDSTTITGAALSDDQVRALADDQSFTVSTSLTDDVTEPNNDEGRTPDTADDDPALVGDEASPSENVDMPTTMELNQEEDDRDLRLSQREDSGIVNVEVQTPMSSGDQPVYSSSSDGEVTMLHHADVVVHASADAAPTDEGTSGQNARTSRRRPSVDSTERSVLFLSLVMFRLKHYNFRLLS